MRTAHKAHGRQWDRDRDRDRDRRRELKANLTHGRSGRSAAAAICRREKALARRRAPDTKLGHYKAPDTLLRFLQAL